MLKLIIGRKGSGKTKRVVDLANEAVANSKGNVIFVEKGNALTFSVSSSIRLIDTSEYNISNYDELFGLISGIMASDYDATQVFVDGTKRIGGDNPNLFAEFAEKLSGIMQQSSPDVIMTISYDENELPASVKKFII